MAGFLSSWSQKSSRQEKSCRRPFAKFRHTFDLFAVDQKAMPCHAKKRCKRVNAAMILKIL